MKYRVKTLWHQFIDRRSPCERLETALSLSVDGMASQKEARAVELHLATCPSCRVLLTSFKATSLALSERPRPEPPAHLSTRLQQAIASERERELARVSGWRPRLAIASLTAAVAAAVAFGVLYRVPQTPVAKAPAAAHPGQNALKALAKLPSLPQARSHAAIRPVYAVAQASRPHELTRQPEVLRHTQEAKVPTPVAHRAPEPPVVLAALPKPNAVPHGATVIKQGPAVLPRRSAPTQVAVLPVRTPQPSASVPPTPVVSIPATREEPPQGANGSGEQHVAVLEESPRVRLASELTNIARGSALAGQKIAQVAIKGGRADYTGIVPITYSTIR